MGIAILDSDVVLFICLFAGCLVQSFVLFCRLGGLVFFFPFLFIFCGRYE